MGWDFAGFGGGMAEAHLGQTAADLVANSETH